MYRPSTALGHPFAHLYETGRMRRVHLRGHANILKRVLLQAGALNLGLLMRQLVGIRHAAQSPGPRGRASARCGGPPSASRDALECDLDHTYTRIVTIGR